MSFAQAADWVTGLWEALDPAEGPRFRRARSEADLAGTVAHRRFFFRPPSGDINDSEGGQVTSYLGTLEAVLVIAAPRYTLATLVAGVEDDAHALIAAIETGVRPAGLTEVFALGFKAAAQGNSQIEVTIPITVLTERQN